MRYVSGTKIDKQSLGGEPQTVKNVRSYADDPFVLILEAPATSFWATMAECTEIAG